MVLLSKIFKLISLSRVDFSYRSFSNISNKVCVWKKCETVQNRIFLISQRSIYTKDDLRLHFLDDKHLYKKLCRKIVLAQKSRRDASQILPVHLALLPLGTTRHHMEKYFVDNILPPWWNLMKNNLTNVSGRTLISTVVGLEKINYICQNEICKFLQFSDIEKIALHSLEDVLKFRAKHFSILLHTLVNFLKTCPSETLSVEMQSTLSRAFRMFFSNAATYVYLPSHFLGDILFYSAKLGFIKNPNEELVNFVPIYLKIFDYKQIVKSEPWLSNCHMAGSAFLEWDYNPGQIFWASYFKVIEKAYDRYKHKERLCATVLKNCARIGLKFSEDEFKNIAPFWTREMTAMVQHLRRPEIEEILDICLKKYSGNLTDIENILSKDILYCLLNRTNSFIINEINSTRSLSYSGIDFELISNELKIDKINYFNISKQIISGEPDHSISPILLCNIPGSALKFQDEFKFVENVALKWWSEFEPKLHDISGYMLVHSLFALKEIDENTNGGLIKRLCNLDISPVLKVAHFTLKDIKNENFTHSSFSILLESIVYFLAATHSSEVETKLIKEISSAFDSFFHPDLFYRRLFVHECPKRIGKILFNSKKLSIRRPPEYLLNVIVPCCSKNFGLQFHVNDSYLVRVHLWNLQWAMDTFFAWDLNADEYHKSFFKLYFNEIYVNYSKLGHSDAESTLKYFLLRTVLLLVIKFDKENEFKQIKNLWTSEMKIFHDQFTDMDIRNIVALSKKHGKFDHLEDIIARTVLVEFKSRVRHI